MGPFSMKYVLLTSMMVFLPATSFAADDDATVAEVSVDAATEKNLEFVRTKVLPLLQARCFECHKDGSALKGGLSLSSRKGMLAGGESGTAIVPGKPEESLLIEAVRYQSFEMPPRTKMPNEEVDILVKWISEGALWPADLDSESVVAIESHFPLDERRKTHWAWQPVADLTPPLVTESTWSNDPLDAFVLAKLEASRLSAAVDADRHTLIRRLYFDIIGLPPSVENIAAFVNDPATDRDAMATVVDRLLASEQFGERWARHWLDLVRYADTLGHEFDYPLHNAWRYRDYVIRALNGDVPYDQFVREHIAGDLLPTPREHATEQYSESIIATGFWFLHEDKHAPVDVRGEEASKIDNQIDVFSKTFLGMTVACARCHDHKFDAISTTDYYALAGFLQSSRRQSGWLDPGMKIKDRVTKLTRKKIDVQQAMQMPSAVDAAELSLAKYASAAVEVIRNKSDAAAAKNVAVESGCDPELLTRWVTLLQQPAHVGTDQTVSLPASLASSDAVTSITDAVDRWKKSVTTKPQSDETTPFADLRHGLPQDWFVLGQAFSGIPRNVGTDLEWRGEELCQNINEGVSSARLSPELQGALTSPTFELQHPEILVRVAGMGCRMRLVIDGYLMFEFSGLLFNGAKQDIKTDGEFRWLRIAGDMHRYQGHRMHLEFLDEGKGWFTVQEIRFANRAGASPPSAQCSDFNLQLCEAMPTDGEEISVEDAIKRWSLAVADSPAATSSLFLNDLLPTSNDAAFLKSKAAWKATAAAIPAPVSVLAITDGTPENERVFIRGNHRNLGDVAPRMILTALRSTEASEVAAGSGRLQLAEQVLKDDNPLTSRVMVNRIWHHLFGVGIVESTDNFGVLGKVPTHPELLDYLANEFRSDGWSIKRMIRRIVLSRTYRMSSDRSEHGDAVDPTNQLHHRNRIRRLQGEAVRDAILAVSGRLDLTPFGSPVPVYLTPFMQGRGRPGTSGPLDGNGRRSIYMAVNRNFLSPLMLAFDVPAPVSTTGKRNSSNVPAQALMLLNNEFVNQQAALWAEKLLAEGHASSREILVAAWYQLLGRPGKDAEIDALLAYVRQEAADDSVKISKTQLAEVCHVLLNTKEFTFLR